jgi:hypothetical protein
MPALTKVRHVFVKAGSRVNHAPKTVPRSRVNASTVCTASATPTELRRVSSYANNNREGADTLRDAVQGLSRWFDRRNRRIAKSRINAHVRAVNLAYFVARAGQRGTRMPACAAAV